MATHPAPLVRAIADIAESAAAAADFDGVRDKHVLKHIDDDVLTAWIEREGGTVAALHAIAEQIEITLLRRDQAGRDADLVQALVRNAPTLTATLHAALVRLVADDLADEAYGPASQLHDDAEPYDDPVRADRIAIAREHNAIVGWGR